MKNIISLSIALLFAINLFSQNIGKNFIDENYIEVTGSAELEIVPNEIYIKVILSEKDNNGREPLEQRETQMINTLKGIGIDVEKDLAIRDFISNFKKYWLKKKDIFTTKEYEILVRDADTAGKVFQQLEKIKISNISIDRLDHSAIEDYRQEVKIKAMKAAKEKANYLAEAIEQKVGKAIHIVEIPNNDNHGSTRRSAGWANHSFQLYKSKEEKTEIVFDKINLIYKIAAKFRLID